MNWKFTIDYTIAGTPFSLDIDEPRGWDKVNFHLKRDTRWHGFFDFIDDSMASLQFIGDGRDVLQTLYGLDGVAAQATLTVSVQCAPEDSYVQIYVGAFDFTSYAFFQGDECYIEIGVETNTAFQKFKNRSDQDVDLDSLVSFDAPPVPQTISTAAEFLSPRIILNTVEEGIIAGSKITVSGSTSNNGTFTVVGVWFTLPFDNLPPEIATNAVFTAPDQVQLDTFNPEILEGSTISIFGSFNAGTYFVSNVTFNSSGTLLTVTPAAIVNEASVAITIQVIQNPSQTTLTVLETVTNEAQIAITITTTYPNPNLTAYNGLNMPLAIKGKAIEYRNSWSINQASEIEYNDNSCDHSSGHIHWNTPKYGFIAFNWDNAVMSEIVESDPNYFAFGGHGGIGEQAGKKYLSDVYDGIINFSTGEPTLVYCAAQNASVHIKLKAFFNIYSADEMTCGDIKMTLFVFKAGVDSSNQPLPIVLQSYGGMTNGHVKYGTINIDSIQSLDLAVGDRVYLGLALINYYYNTRPDPFNVCATAFKMNISFVEGNLEVTLPTICDTTQNKVYMINETLSRCAEAYTNDELRVYSDYFGRTDAQPYSSPETGCGGLECVMNGLKLRNAPVPNDQTRIRMTTNFQNCFKSLDAIHNIGMGLEDDALRPGYKWLRVEPQQYFFNNTILMECDAIQKLERKLDSTMIFSTMKIGYQKQETWNNNGLYDLYGQRTFRTELRQLMNELDKTSPFIASDYAIEFTRRLYGLTTADSRYDNDIFILCLQNTFTGEMIFTTGFNFVVGFKMQNISVGDTLVISNTVSNNGTFTVVSFGYGLGGTFITVAQPTVAETVTAGTIVNNTHPLYAVEQGNISNPYKISQPDTVFNYRITPAHNALRQFKTIIMSAKDYLTSKIKFTSGTGNFYGFGWLQDDCAIEGSILGEGVDLDVNNFDNLSQAHPLYKPELVTYDYPMSWEDFLVIYANPYGLIGYQQGDAPKEYGWIEDLGYDPYRGMAKFTLRPQLNSFSLISLANAGVLLEAEGFVISG